MASDYVCQCGKTEIRGNKHPYDCQTCPECGSKIQAQGEEYDTPLEHSVVERTDDYGRKYMQCKRCEQIL